MPVCQPRNGLRMGPGFNRDARVIVKATWEHGSLGLDETSVMRCADAPRVIAAHTMHLKTEHFAEAYIEGREFHLALLERISGVEVLPITEIMFEGLEAHAPKIYGYDAKWTPDSAAYIGTVRRFGLEQDEPELAKTLKQFARACWTLFGFSGYARVDFRVDPTGAPFIIDVNPNPYLTRIPKTLPLRREAGLSYQDLIASIVESSLGISQVVLGRNQLDPFSSQSPEPACATLMAATLVSMRANSKVVR